MAKVAAVYAPSASLATVGTVMTSVLGGSGSEVACGAPVRMSTSVRGSAATMAPARAMLRRMCPSPWVSWE